MSVVDASIHPLDRPIWNALTTRQRALAEGGARALRYPAAVAPFADMADMSPESFAALGAIMSGSEIAVLFTPDAVTAPDEFKIMLAETGEQMIGTPAESAIDGVETVTLGADDVPAMMALTELTKPGPFSVRTHELGTFLGVRIDGELVAMAGERMKPANYTEMTAVCVHPSHRGRGYGQVLLGADFPPDRRAGRDPVSARIFQQRLGDRAVPAAGDGNPAQPACDGAAEARMMERSSDVCSTSPSRWHFQSSDPDHDLAEMFLRLHGRDRFMRVIEIEHLVDHRPVAVELDRPAHRIEVGDAADGDAPDGEVLAHHHRQREARRLIAGEDADHRDMAAEPAGLDACARVSPPPTSTTRWAPSPPVAASTAADQSGVVR